MRKYLGITLISVGLGIVIGVIYANSIYSKKIRTFSAYTLLVSSWEKYKIRFIETSGRVIDNSQNNVTTSEGQSYAMLKSVWMDDKTTFDKVWNWTRVTLKRPNDNLFGWRWGNLGGNDYGFLPDGGNNSAADADTDIALALILAGKRWRQQEYIEAAKPIVADIWKHEVSQAGNRNYVIAGNWAKDNERIIVNPSYFAPYAWRLFGQIDENDWESLIDPAFSYSRRIIALAS